MKIYKEHREQEKSWALNLRESEESISLVAVDAHTGKYVATFLIFKEEGDIFPAKGVFDAIHSQGYDPREHGNTFYSDGSLVIKNREQIEE